MSEMTLLPFILHSLALFLSFSSVFSHFFFYINHAGSWCLSTSSFSGLHVLPCESLTKSSMHFDQRLKSNFALCLDFGALTAVLLWQGKFAILVTQGLKYCLFGWTWSKVNLALVKKDRKLHILHQLLYTWRDAGRKATYLRPMCYFHFKTKANFFVT